MSTCPEQDMHSVYLDGELPQKYALDYESHLTGCQDCRDRYLKLQRLGSLLKEDAAASQLSPNELEDSFSKLQTKLRYCRNTKKTEPADVRRFTWMVPAVAAAALAFALVLPARDPNRPGASPHSGSPISISSSALTGVLSAAPSINTNAARFIKEPAIIVEEPIERHIKPASLSPDGVLSPMDIFRPAFEEKGNVSVRMSLSDLQSLPHKGEISVPIQMYITISGN